ncbi:DDE-type integrase/transposase/recombinase [Rhizobium ruizarguesonis]|uniref:DDE-type integrase/transposase/recombinase n=1 Tax=Rhizobium ruizarguesonis TaxID=2081791 RepID=UPI0013EEA311|nr:DDE-type integrase/transposase/recombinase [Rhizobium ruizarguesonis]
MSKKHTKFNATAGDLFTFDGRPYDFEQEFEDGIVIGSNDDKPKNVVAMTWQQIDGYIRTYRLQIEKGHYSVANAIKRAKERKSPTVSHEATFRHVLVASFLEEEASGGGQDAVSRSDAKIKKFYAKFRVENEELVDNARDELKKKKAKRNLFVSRRQFCRWIVRFEKNARAADSLMRQNKGSTSYGSSFSDEQLAYYGKFVRGYLNQNQPTVRAAYNMMLADVLACQTANEPFVEPCSESTFLRLARDMDDRDVDFARHKDKHRIQRKYTFSGKGLQPTYAMQILEMDEHKLDLMRVAKNLGIWERLHEDVQALMEAKSRAWVSVAMDAYSRSICGIRVLPGEPEAAEAVATLAMAVRNKEHETALSGGNFEWPQCGRPDAVHTDAGAAYVSGDFQRAVIGLTGKHRIPPSKHPHLRGRVERFFGTLNSRYMHLFSGRTYSNVLMKDKYDPAKHAHLTHMELTDLLIRLIVVCYHNTPHRSLNGETPLERWYRSSQEEREVMPPPTQEEYRDIFGIQMTRKVGNNGITILGLDYRSEQLSSVREWKYNVELNVRINDQNMSAISFEDPRDGKWHDAQATFEGLDNVPLTDWMETVRFIVDKHGPKARNARRAKDLVLKTLADVVKASESSRLAANVGSPLQNEARIVEFEKKNMANFEYSRHLWIDFGNDGGEDAASAEGAAARDNDPLNPVGDFSSDRFIDPQSKTATTKKNTQSRKPAPTPSTDDDAEIDTSDVVLEIDEKDGSND